MRKTLLSFIALFIVQFCVHAQIVSNSGFESSLTNWTTSTINGSSATFTITSNTGLLHTGTKALTVVVTNSGTASNSVKLTHSSFTTSTARTYLLRFWALSSVRDNQINVNLKGSTTSNQCLFKIWNRMDTNGNGWQMYQYAFKTTETPTTLELNFNNVGTYYLDDVEIIDDTDAKVNVTTQYLWQNNLSGWGWISGDNDVSTELPDGRIAWLYNDSFMGTPNSHSNVLNFNAMINNLIVTQSTGGTLSSIYGGTQSSPSSLFLPTTSGNLFWICDGIVENNKLKILLQEWSGGNYASKASVATLSLPGLTVDNIVPTSYTGSDIPYSILEDDDYNYIYTVERAGTFEIYSRVARVPKGTLNTSVLWEFYSNSNTWSRDFSQAKRIISGVEASSVIKLGKNNYCLSGVSHLSNELCVWFATSPVGPWGNKAIVYTIPQEEGMLAYMGHINAGTGKNQGLFTLSYSVYPFGGGWDQQLSDKGIYIPYYAKANLRALSPYTVNDCAGVFGGSAYTDACGTCVGGTTGKLECIPNAGDNLALNKATTTSSVDGTMTGSLAVDGNTSTRWGSTNSDPQWIYVDLGATYNIGSVRVVWEYASAKNYLIQVSSDATNWSTIKTITNNSSYQNDHLGLTGSGRYLRIYGTARTTMFGYSIYELQVYAQTVTNSDITNLPGLIASQYTDSPAGEEATKLIDNNSATKFLTFHNAAYVQFAATARYVVSSYTMTSANDDPTRDPLNWTLQGSNDGSAWTTIDTRSGEDFPNRLQTRTFTMTNTVAYQYYRLNMTNNSGTILQLAEIQLFGAPCALIPGQTYRIINRNSGLAMDVYSGLTANGTNVDQWSYGNGAHQQWVINPTGDGYYRVSSANSGKVLEVNGSSLDNGGNVQQWDYYNQTNQQWSVTYIGNGYYKVLNRNSGKALEVSNNSLINGGNVQQWDFTNAASQQWSFIQVNGVKAPKSITIEQKASADESSDICLYLNPENRLFVNGLRDDTNIMIYNTLGILIKEEYGSSVDVSALTSGSYILKIKAMDGFVGKFIIK